MNALVTGASRGFGRALAASLARAGWRLVIDGRDASALEAAAEAIGAGSVTAIAGDVADPAHRDQLVEAAAALGSVDLIVNNASALGPSPLPPLAAHPIDELEYVFRVNVIAPLALVQQLLPHMGSGTIVNLSSDAAVEAYERWGGYGSSKAALDHMSAVLAAEHPQLRVYAFDPGDMRTAMHQAAEPDEDISRLPSAESVVPALTRLLQDRPPSGRYRAAQFLTGVGITA